MESDAEATPGRTRAAAPVGREVDTERVVRPAQSDAVPPSATSIPQQSKRAAARKSAIAPPSAADADQPRIALSEPPASRARTAARAQETRTPAAPVQQLRGPDAGQADAEATSGRVPMAAPAARKAAGETIALAKPLNLPNRPASALELKIGDSWTYRLTDIRLGRNLATVTHEIDGGDASGIRETLRVGEEQAATQRRVSLEPRVFEQRLDSNTMLFEFAPFLTESSELRPGASWARIAGASSDSLNEWRFSGKVTGSERVRVPAGTFEATKAELEGQRDISFPSSRDVYQEIDAARQTYLIWFVPEIGRAVKYERRTYNRANRLLEHQQYELLSYKLK
jgi:hypothetical protein